MFSCFLPFETSQQQLSAISEVPIMQPSFFAVLISVQATSNGFHVQVGYILVFLLTRPAHNIINNRKESLFSK
jgi:hypothetical protein